MSDRDEDLEVGARAMAGFHFDFLGGEWFQRDDRAKYIELTWKDNLPLLEAAINAIEEHQDRIMKKK